MPQTTPISELDAQAVEINRLQRAMAHMLDAHKASSSQVNALRYAKGQLDKKIAEQDEKLAARDDEIAALKDQVAATWRVAIRAAANVAEFTEGAPKVALAIGLLENETPEQIAEMLQAASGE